jgi:hypothetical protein
MRQLSQVAASPQMALPAHAPFFAPNLVSYRKDVSTAYVQASASEQVCHRASTKPTVAIFCRRRTRSLTRPRGTGPAAQGRAPCKRSAWPSQRKPQLVRGRRREFRIWKRASGCWSGCPCARPRTSRPRTASLLCATLIAWPPDGVDSVAASTPACVARRWCPGPL